MTPDLTVLGKVIGGGLPAAAYAGPARADGAGRARRRRLPGGHAVGQPARHRRRAWRRSRCWTRDAYARLDAAHRDARRRACEAAAATPACPSTSVARTGLLTVFFPDGPVPDYDGAKACDLDRYAAFCRAMLERGVYLPPSQFEAWFPSLAHTDEHVERTLAAAREALRRSRVSVARARCVGGAPSPRWPPHAVADPGPRPLRRRASATATASSCSRRSTRATCSTTASRARSPAWTPTCACSPATRSTRSASRALAERGDLEAVAELADLISAPARAHAEGRAARAAERALGRDSARAVCARRLRIRRGASCRS